MLSQSEKAPGEWRHTMFSLWDVLDNKEVGVGHVEWAPDVNATCRHRWVLWDGWRYVKTGLRYKPIDNNLDWDQAEAELRATWGKGARLVDCQARSVHLKEPFPAIKKLPIKTNKAPHFERIDFKGCHVVLKGLDTIGYVYIPNVQTMNAFERATDRSTELSRSFLADRGRLGMQNRYDEYWVLENARFPVLQEAIEVVTNPEGVWKPRARSFFRDVAAKLAKEASCTEVTCATYVQT